MTKVKRFCMAALSVVVAIALTMPGFAASSGSTVVDVADFYEWQFIRNFPGSWVEGTAWYSFSNEFSSREHYMLSERYVRNVIGSIPSTSISFGGPCSNYFYDLGLYFSYGYYRSLSTSSTNSFLFGVEDGYSTSFLINCADFPLDGIQISSLYLGFLYTSGSDVITPSDSYSWSRISPDIYFVLATDISPDQLEAAASQEDAIALVSSAPFYTGTFYPASNGSVSIAANFGRAFSYVYLISCYSDGISLSLDSSSLFYCFTHGFRASDIVYGAVSGSASVDNQFQTIDSSLSSLGNQFQSNTDVILSAIADAEANLSQDQEDLLIELQETKGLLQSLIDALRGWFESLISAIMGTEQEQQLKADSAPVVEQFSESFASGDNSLSSGNIREVGDTLGNVKGFFDTGFSPGDLWDAFDDVSFGGWFSADTAADLDSTASAMAIDDMDDGPYNTHFYSDQINALKEAKNRGGDE